MYISKFGGIIAAASKKAAQPTLEIGTIAVVKRIVLTFQQAGVFPIVVVTGVEANEVRFQLAGRGVVFLHIPEYQDPELFTSVCMGLKFLANVCERIVFAPANVPLFMPATLASLQHESADIVTPLHAGHGGHPVIISNDIVPDILQYTGENGLRGAMEHMENHRKRIEVNDEGVLLSIHDRVALQQHFSCNKSGFIHASLHLSIEREKELYNARAKLLLFLIGKTQSVRKASEMMGLSPSKAWDTLNTLEKALGYALITRRQGGKNGSGSELTPSGLEFLCTSQRYEELVLAYAQKQFHTLFCTTGIITSK